jgi:nucleoside-diphosphate-sugar epimerase
VVAVTGGAGFVGAQICEALAGEAREMICIDDVTTEAARNLAQFQDAPAFRLLRHDTIQPFPDDLPGLDELYERLGRTTGSFASPLGTGESAAVADA